MDGLLLIDKPKGWTSFDVVAVVRGMIKRETGFKKPKVGHTGTLDPLATGLLVLCLGSYCKRAQEFSKLDKVYEVTIRLGETSTTDDAEGEVTAVSDQKPSQQEIAIILQKLVGNQMQVPPIFSAIKIDGQRAYKMARKGQEVKMEPRSVTIHSITDMKYAYPEVTFTVHVSSGTYVRSLARDVGEKLGTGAYMSDLRRIKVGSFELVDAQGMDVLDLRKLLHI